MDTHGKYHSGVYTKNSAIFQKYQGMSIMSESLEGMRPAQKIAFKVGRKCLQTTASAFFTHGINVYYPGYEPQVVLPMKYWKSMGMKEYKSLWNEIEMNNEKRTSIDTVYGGLQ